MRHRFLSTCAALALRVCLPAQDEPHPLDRVEYLSAYERNGTHHASCEGLVVDAAGQPVAGARAIVYAYLPFYQALPLAEARTDANGRFVVGDVRGEGRTALWIVSADGAPFASVEVPVTLVSGERVRVRPITLAPGAPPGADAPAPAVVRGTVLDTKGTPIAGVFVGLQPPGDAFDPGAFATTGADGRFVIRSRLGVPQLMVLFLPDRRVTITHRAGQEKLVRRGRGWEGDLSSELVLELEQRAAVPLQANGAKATFSFARGGRWIACGDSVSLDEERGSCRIRADAAGHVPRIASAPLKAPVEFTDGPRFRVRLRSGDAALPGAHVDVCMLHEGDEETWLGDARTDAEGKLELIAEPGAAYAVYAYADGHEPARAVWHAGHDVDLVLRPHSGRLKVAAGGEASIFVRPAGCFAPAAVRYVRADEPAEFTLAPGPHEVTRYGENGAIAQAVEIVAGETATAALERDTRPVVTVQLPAVAGKGEWKVWGSRSASGGMIAKWRAASGGGRTPPTRELVAEVEPVADAARTFRLRFPISGRFTIACQHAVLRHRYLHDVDLSLGSELKLQLPEPNCKLTGEMPAFPEVWESGAQHGIAGPRFLLRHDPRAGAGWSVKVTLPEPKQFTIERLPPGRYLVEHHLYETGFFRSDEGTFGGVPLPLEAAAAADAGVLGREGGTIQIEVVDGGGKPFAGRIAIRDRMYESWERVLADGSTLHGALDPIPTPPSARLEDGKAKLAKVRAGRVELVLTTDDGRRIWFERDVKPGAEHRFVLAAPTRRQ